MPKRFSLPQRDAGFVEPMECLGVKRFPEGPLWSFEVKLDGYRLEVVRTPGAATLYSRRRSVLTRQFPSVVEAVQGLPFGTVLDGEIVALDSKGHPSFNLLQNYRSAAPHIVYFAFDILVLRDRDLMRLSLAERREILQTVVRKNEHFDLSFVSPSAPEMLTFVRERRLEGIVAKRIDSVYQPGQRTGLWAKYRPNCEQPFVIGGYVPSHLGIDSLVIGFYCGTDLIYAGRVRDGFVPATRRRVFEAIRHLRTERCPFVGLPESTAGRWGQGLTAEKMKLCVWVKPETVAQVEFLEWTGSNHLRHTKFVSLRDDTAPQMVFRDGKD
jgi:bifunctional non-homologous end joining protein LigD